MILKKINILSVAKIAGLIYGLLGLLFGSIGAIVALAGGFNQSSSQLGASGPIFGVAMLVLLPIVYGLIGFIFTAIGAALFNLASGVTGGVEIEVAVLAPPQQPFPQP
jgi:hypothetical protein